MRYVNNVSIFFFIILILWAIFKFYHKGNNSLVNKLLFILGNTVGRAGYVEADGRVVSHLGNILRNLFKSNV